MADSARIIAVTKPVIQDVSDVNEFVAYCARVSNPSNQSNTLTSSRLMAYLIKHKHWSPFEMINVVMEINTTRDIARQILRHRSFCLGADSIIWFDLPDENSPLKFKPYKKTISYLYDRFHNGAAPLPNGIRMPMREKISNMLIRCVNEETGEITHTHINDITKNTAILYKVTFDNGNVVTSSMDHKYLTDHGWLTLSQALEINAKFVAQGQKSEKPTQEFPEIDESTEKWASVDGWENYLISTEGRLKRIGRYSGNKIRSGTPSKSIGYPVVSMNRPGYQIEVPVHQLVLKTFKPLLDYTDMVVRHKNHNKLDNRLCNLEWGTHKDNSMDSVESDICGRLRTNLTSVIDYECLGEQDCYDISVVGPWHNFICDGQVVHNSFQEFSQRYADPTSDLGFSQRDARLQDQKNRQNSIESDDDLLKKQWFFKQQQIIHETKLAYKWATENGIAKEQARVVLPEGLTVSRMYMNGNLRSWIHYCQLRMGPETQKEHREIAMKCWEEIKVHFPVLENLEI
jgi:thymidylate synthase ThyX